MLSVKIKNTADSAYQPEVYGDSIIVERQFSRAGASGFKLKSSSGRLISNRKADLDEICDYFALQIDNPMNVLTQDMARQFLNQSGPAEKYKFFMRGTQLEQLSNDYVLIAEDIDTIQQQLELRGADIKVYEDAANKAKALQAMSEKQNTLRMKLRRYANQMAWAQVEDQERQLASYDRDLRKADQTIAGVEQKSRDVDQKYEDVNLAYGSASEHLQQCKERLDPLLEEKAQMKQEFDQVKNDAVTNQVSATNDAQGLQIFTSPARLSSVRFANILRLPKLELRKLKLKLWTRSRSSNRLTAAAMPNGLLKLKIRKASSKKPNLRWRSMMAAYMHLSEPKHMLRSKSRELKNH